MSTTRNAGHVLDLIADGLHQVTPACTPEVVRDGNGRALAILVHFSDGDTWTVATTPHHVAQPTDRIDTAAAVYSILRDPSGITYLSGDEHSSEGDHG